ncbi:MAG: hypothetical protein HPY81_09075 [Firmicutes bacterium]|nr:hypothetical protein [Bacillota bacterium]
MYALIEILAVFVAIYIFLKFCGVCQKFALGAGAKKAIYIITAVGLIVANYLYNHSQLQAITLGFVILILLTIALMSETKPSH